jgi:hypothetical protein
LPNVNVLTKNYGEIRTKGKLTMSREQVIALIAEGKFEGFDDNEWLREQGSAHFCHGIPKKSLPEFALALVDDDELLKEQYSAYCAGYDAIRTFIEGTE